MVSTLYFKAAWEDEFNADLTAPDTFTNASGKAETCDFLHASSKTNLYRGSQFTAVQKPLQNNGGMWLILPNEGVTTDALLGDAELTQFLLANGVKFIDQAPDNNGAHAGGISAKREDRKSVV